MIIVVLVQAANRGRVADPNITKYSVKALPVSIPSLLIFHSANNSPHSHHVFSFCSFMFFQNNGHRMFTNLVNLSVGNDLLLNRGIVTSHRSMKLCCFA